MTMGTPTLFLRLLLFFALFSFTHARRTRGYIQLSGKDTEHVLNSFVIGPKGGRITVRLGSDTPYDNDRHIKLRVYRDTEWAAMQKAPLCTEKIKLAHKTSDLNFAYKGDGPMAPKGGKYQAVRTVLVADPNVPEEVIDRPHYYYFVVDDCSLEAYDHDAAVPKLYFEINTWNYYGSKKKRRTTQMGADEDWLWECHEVSILVSGGLLAWLVFMMFWRLGRKQAQHTVHVAVFWIAIAVALDLGSSICQIVHLEIYHYNGVGLYFMDALSTHLECVCDVTIMIFLLSIAAGWTLPSDVVGLASNQGVMQQAMSDLSNPLSALARLSPAGLAGVGFLAVHVILAQLGRTYNDDFDSYHDYNHLPGHITIFIRILMGLLFLGTTFQTKLRCKVKQLQTFYTIVGILGVLWFEAMPVVTFTCNWMLPFHLRHPVVFLASATLQCSSLILLSWLVTSHSTTYHQYSHMSSSDKPSLTESLSSPSNHSREWRIMGKTKVRLD